MTHIKLQVTEDASDEFNINIKSLDIEKVDFYNSCSAVLHNSKLNF